MSLGRPATSPPLPPDPIGAEAIGLLRSLRAMGGTLPGHATEACAVFKCYFHGLVEVDFGKVTITSAGTAYLDRLARAH